jgi:hypothetical protein
MAATVLNTDSTYQPASQFGVDNTGVPYAQYAAAYQAVYGKAPPMAVGDQNYYKANPNAVYNPAKGGVANQVPLSTLMAMAQAKTSGVAAVQAAPQQQTTGNTAFGSGGTNASSATGQSYLGPQPMAANGITQIGSGNGYTILSNGSGRNLARDAQGNYFDIGADGSHHPVSDLDAAKLGFQATNPETNALLQMGQIDPASEALRQQTAASYADPSQKATAADYQSYLNTFKQVDPTEYAQRQGLATSMNSYLKSMQDQAALGSKLDPVTQMQVEQAARKGQADRGNLYGSGQAAVEAMTTGQAGQALLQQRQQALQSALGGQQSYLGAGLGLGDTAMQLYQQGLANKANAQQGALSYLSSGQTPYQAGASYLANAEGAAGNAAQGGPVYNPASLGTSYSGSAQSAPQYGIDLGAQSQNYFNSLNNAYGGGGGATKNRGGAAMAGAASGALSGATAGAALGGPYAPITAAAGGLLGGALGGASGYYS